MKRKICILISGLFFFLSCKKNEFVNSPVTLEIKDSVIRERMSDKPLILSKKRYSNSGNMIRSLADEQLGLKSYLGRAYDARRGDIGSPECVRFPVINITSLLTDYPDYYLSKHIGASEATRFSFSNFDRYQEKYNTTLKTSGGFSLNLGLFSIGAKHKFENAFSKSLVNENNRVFGELNVKVKDASYEILMSSNTFKKIKEDYISPIFLDELYNSPTSEFADNYGGFVITNFFSGGRANALYTGVYSSTSTEEIKEGSMDNSISASFSFTKKESSVDFGLGNKNGSSIAESNNIFSFSSCAKTYGGGYGLSSFTVPKKIDDINIDLSGWASSLNDKSTHVLVDINDNGLKPITDFILQDNIRSNINNYLNGKKNPEPFEEPCIEVLEGIQWPIGYACYVLLVTRFGDRLLIGSYNKFRSLADAHNFGLTLLAQKTPFYKVKVVARGAALPTGFYTTPIDGIDEAGMKKFYDVKHKMLYLLSVANGRKFAYSIHDDFLLDTYVIRDWVNNMQSTVISQTDLESYTIIAL